MSDSETQVVEPLAKFHVPVISKFRVVIPDGEKELFNLTKGTYVEVIIRAIDTATLRPLKRIHTLVKLTGRGMFTITKPMREELGIKIGDIIEILLIARYSLEDMVKEEYRQLFRFVDNGFEVVDEAREQEIIAGHRKKT